MAAAKQKTPADLSSAEKQQQEQKREFRDLRGRLAELREMAQASATRRKELEARLGELAAQLGIELKGKETAG